MVDFQRVFFMNRNSSDEIITLKWINLPEDLEFLSELPRDAFFSIFIPSHQKMAAKLIELFLSKSSIYRTAMILVFIQIICIQVTMTFPNISHFLFA